MPFCNGADRGSNFASLERGLTSCVACNAPVGVTLREMRANLNSRHVYNEQFYIASGCWPDKGKVPAKMDRKDLVQRVRSAMLIFVPSILIWRMHKIASLIPEG